MGESSDLKKAPNYGGTQISKEHREGILGRGTGRAKAWEQALLSANAGGVVGWQAVWDRQCSQTREGPKGLELGRRRCHPVNTVLVTV